jgi:hypothetical protein
LPTTVPWALSNSEHCPAGGPERSWVTWSGGAPRKAVTVFRHERGRRWAWRDPPSLPTHLEADGPAIYNITDDEPAPMRDWLPALAAAMGAKPPFHVPAWVGRLVMGKTLTMITEARGAANAKAKKELGWPLRYPSWRVGFPAAYGR